MRVPPELPSQAARAPRHGPLPGPTRGPVFGRWLATTQAAAPDPQRPTGPGRPAAVARAGPPEGEGNHPAEREASERHAPGTDELLPWAAFQPPPPVLQPLAGAGQPPPASGSAAAHAEIAALAERLLTSLRVGRVGERGREVRMRLGPRLGGLEVRLKHEAGRLTAELHAEPWARDRALRIADRLQHAIRARGAALDAIEVR
ncbi:MAG: hypothetical protein ACODAU_08260 [Myxococcota bacterium]